MLIEELNEIIINRTLGTFNKFDNATIIIHLSKKQHTML